MKQTFIFCYAMVLYLLTTLVLVLVPVQVRNLDINQIMLLVILGVLGYAGGSLALYVYIDNKRHNIPERF